jgi:hypothetical protein
VAVALEGEITNPMAPEEEEEEELTIRKAAFQLLEAPHMPLL